MWTSTASASGQQVQFGRQGAAAVAAAAGGRTPAGDKALATADGVKGPSSGAAAIPLPGIVDALIAVRL